MIGIILFAEDYEILLTFIEILKKKNLKLEKKREREEWYEYCGEKAGEKIELYSVLGKGYKRLVEKLKAFLENKIFESMIYRWIKNRGFRKVVIIILYDKDKEKEMKPEIDSWKKEFEKSFNDVKEYIEIKHKGVGIEFLDFSPEIESYFIKREYDKKEISEKELEEYKKLSNNKASLALYLKQILKFKEKPSMKVYLEKALKEDKKLIEELEKELLISELLAEIGLELL